MTNINPKFHRVERVSKTVEMGAKPKLIIPEPNRRIRVSRHLSGKIIMDIDGRDRITLLPDQAFRLATGILKGLGIDVGIEWHGQQ